MKKIYLRYNDEKEIRNPIECNSGVAWLMILIGPFYPYFKKDYKMFILILFLQAILSLLFIIAIRNNIVIALLTCIVMIFLVNTLFAFNYNMIVIECFLKMGYVPMDYNSSDYLLKKGIYFKLQ